MKHLLNDVSMKISVYLCPASTLVTSNKYYSSLLLEQDSKQL